MFNLPLSDEQLFEFVENQDKEYDIYITNKEFDNKTSLIYISNLNIKCNCIFANSDIKLDFIKEYLISDRIVNIPNVEKMVIKIFLYSIGYVLDDFKTDITNEECDLFIQENMDLIEKINTFLNSLILYSFIVYVQDDNKDDFLKDIEIIDDNKYVGVNIVNTLKYKELSFYYIFNRLPKQYNFIHQFNDYMFDGNNLYYYFNNENNMLIKMVPLIFEQ